MTVYINVSTQLVTCGVVKVEAMAYIEDVVVHVLILLQAEDVIFLRFGGFWRGDLPTVIRRRLSSLKQVVRNSRVSL